MSCDHPIGRREKKCNQAQHQQSSRKQDFPRLAGCVDWLGRSLRGRRDMARVQWDTGTRSWVYREEVRLKLVGKENPGGLRDPDMQRALADHLRMLDKAKKHPNPERDIEQWRRLIRWVTSRIDASEATNGHADTSVAGDSAASRRLLCPTCSHERLRANGTCVECPVCSSDPNKDPKLQS